MLGWELLEDVNLLILLVVRSHGVNSEDTQHQYLYLADMIQLYRCNKMTRFQCD
jgi:hypothetical protein